MAQKKTKQKPVIREKALVKGNQWQAYTVLHPQSYQTPVTAKRAVRKAHEKHQHDLAPVLQALPPSRSPSLADRFHALPAELRARVFSFLVVQPVKWDIFHQPTCPRTSSNADITPKAPQAYVDRWARFGRYQAKRKLPCAAQWKSTRPWRQGLLYIADPEAGETWTSPWRSRWAPKQKNPYVCSNCYERVRVRPFPKARSLPCLCARREGLQVLLVCKKWFGEAAAVFYSENTFSFEDATSFVAFAQNLNPRWKCKISRVSILLAGPRTGRPDEIDYSNQGNIPTTSPRPNMWTLLRNLPHLSYLELDLSFVLEPRSARAAYRLGHRNLAQVRFIQRVPDDPEWAKGSTSMWPQFAGRSLHSGGFVEEMARAMKGQRQKQLKSPKVFKDKVREFRWAMEKKAIGL